MHDNEELKRKEMQDAILGPVSPLLNELEKSRKKLEENEKQLDTIKNGLSNIFENKDNYRNKYIMDDKLKVLSTFNSAILNIRQEINKLIIQEIKIRRDISIDTKNENKTDETKFRDLLDATEKQRSDKWVVEDED